MRARSRSRSRFDVVLVGAFGLASVHCGSSTNDAIDDDASISDASTPTDGVTSDVAFDVKSCKSIGAACAAAGECCVGACTAGACGGATDGGAAACSATGGACAKGFDCCSGTCAAGKCAGVSGDAAPPPSSCLAPAATCTTSPQCCSGLCEPVTGSPGVVRCRDACRGNGVACTDAQDCCSLGCFGGVCTDTLCVMIGDDCTKDSDCCSETCDATDHKCAVDPGNSRCRPTGESCGSGPQSGCCGATADDDLCRDGRCGLPPGTCRGLTAACATDADCCSSVCDASTKKCAPACKPTSGPCTTGADCCTGSCTDGACDPPLPPPVAGDAGVDAVAPPPVCKSVGVSCTTNAECCTSICLAGFCDAPIR